MEATQLLTWIIGTLTGLGVLTAGVGYGYGQFRRGMRTVDDETIASLQRQLTTLRGELDELKRENKEYVALNNQLQGQLKTYKEIALNQNPEMKEILKTLSEVVPALVSSVQYCQTRNK